MLQLKNWEGVLKQLSGCTADLSGCGEDALRTAELLQSYGVIVLTLSSDEGWIYDYEDLDVQAAKTCSSLKDYMTQRPLSKFDCHSRVWESPCDVAIACEGGDEITAADVKRLAANGCKFFSGKVQPAAMDVIREMGLIYIA